MKKRLLFVLLSLFFVPVFTNAEEVKLTCDKLEVKKDEEINCQIVANDVEYVTTSVVGQVTIDDNMELISSEYDSENWKMLDQEFSVRSINLMSENLELKDNYVIAEFKLRSISDETVFSTVSFDNVLLGDENYENHEIEVEEVKIYSENIAVNNPTTGIDQPYMVSFCIIAICGIGFCLLKNKKYI